jgi:hypothetical protein
MTLLLTLDDGSVQRKLADAVGFARAAVLDEAPEEQIGGHVGAGREDAVTASHLFEAQVPGYRGWRWSVTIALAGDDEPVTVSEVVLVPGPEARIAPAWVPWERRVRAGDLGVGDIFPTDAGDPRLAPAYLQSDDPAVEEVARETGLGRIHVLSRYGREDAATRWHGGEFGPRSDMARSAPGVCGTCGFFVPLAGSLRGGFGACTNDIAPADGHVVDVEYGCGAHSEVEVEITSSIPVAELVYDDSLLDFESAPAASGVADPTEAEDEAVAVDSPAAEPETALAEADLAPAEVEPEMVAVEQEAVAEPEAVAESAAAPEAAAAEVEVPEQAEVAVAAAESVAIAEPAVATEPQAAAGAKTAEVELPGQADVVAEPQAAAPEVEQTESTQAEVTDAVAADVPEPVQVEAADVVAEPQAVVPEAEAAESQAAEPYAAVTEPVVAEVPEPSQAAVTDLVAEPQVVGPEVEQDVATGSVAETQAESTQTGVVAVAPEVQQVESTQAAEPQVAESEAAVAEPVVVPEPGRAAVADALAEPEVGEADVPTAPEGEHAADETDHRSDR